MWIRLARQGPPAWACRPLVGYRVHSSNSSLDIEEVIRGTRLIETLHQTQADWGRLHRWFAESCLRTGNRTGAVAHLARAAVRGEFAGVVADMWTVVARRFARPRGTHEPQTPAASSNTWTAAARAWVRELELPPVVDHLDRDGSTRDLSPRG